MFGNIEHDTSYLAVKSSPGSLSVNDGLIASNIWGCLWFYLENLIRLKFKIMKKMVKLIKMRNFKLSKFQIIYSTLASSSPTNCTSSLTVIDICSTNLLICISLQRFCQNVPCGFFKFGNVFFYNSLNVSTGGTLSSDFIIT